MGDRWGGTVPLVSLVPATPAQIERAAFVCRITSSKISCRCRTGRQRLSALQSGSYNICTGSLAMPFQLLCSAPVPGAQAGAA